MKIPPRGMFKVLISIWRWGRGGCFHSSFQLPTTSCVPWDPPHPLGDPSPTTDPNWSAPPRHNTGGGGGGAPPPLWAPHSEDGESFRVSPTTLFFCFNVGGVFLLQTLICSSRLYRSRDELFLCL